MARAEDQVEGQDEEFVFHLGRGSESLSRGDALGARAALERALELRPRDAEVLGLLGQACYRLGRYDDAIVAWQRLVDENPAEPAARVNLGLAFLRAKRQAQATRQLEIALDLNPDHKKAMGYLGLALLESGDPVRAREWFVKAGSEQMVARCDQVLAGAAAPASGPAAAADDDALPVDVDVDEAAVRALAAPSPPPAHAEPDAPGLTPLPLGPAPAAPVSTPPLRPAPAAGSAGMAPISVRAEPVEAPTGVATPPARPVPAPASAASDIAAFAASRSVVLSDGASFGIAGGVLSVRVKPAVRVRLAGLLAVRGAVEAEPEVKRFRGRPTEKPFGEAAARLHLLRGDGAVLFAAGPGRFTALQVAEAAFFREEAVFGMEEALAFENGRVPSERGGELNLVHVRGQGAVLLSTAGEMQALEVGPEAPLRLPAAALVGWVGALTPRLVALLEGRSGGADGVELSGEGRVLVDPGAVEPREAAP